MLVAESDHAVFYSHESYVFRWTYTITVVRELEGLTPGLGPFARDRKYQKELQAKREGTGGGGQAGGKGEATSDEKKRTRKEDDDSDSEDDLDSSDEESRRILESSGRDRCAYFFWQGIFIHVLCTILMSVCICYTSRLR